MYTEYMLNYRAGIIKYSCYLYAKERTDAWAYPIYPGNFNVIV